MSRSPFWRSLRSRFIRSAGRVPGAAGDCDRRTVERLPRPHAGTIEPRDLLRHRRRDWLPLGTLRRSDPGPCPRHHGAQGRERRNRAPALRVCGWRCDLAGVRAPAGGRFFSAIKQRLATGVLIWRGLGAAVLVGVAATATGLDTDILSNVTTIDTTPLEQSLISTFGITARHRTVEPVVQPADDHQTSFSGDLYGASLIPAAFTGATFDASATSSRPQPKDLEAKAACRASRARPNGSIRGRFGRVPARQGRARQRLDLCGINCRHVLPYVKVWAAKYRSAGLVVVGVHTPELAFERVTANVRQAVQNYGISYPVAVDTNSAIWNSFANEFWPSHYFADARGRLRYHHFGEGDYKHQEEVIRNFSGRPSRQSSGRLCLARWR